MTISPKTPPPASSLGHRPTSAKWEFDATVTAVFDDMLRRSIPAYHEMRSLVYSVARPFAKDGTAIVDLGCSRGEALAPFVHDLAAANRFVGVEVSPPMAQAARERYVGLDTLVEIQERDLRSYYPRVKASVTLAVLTLQFVPINYRQRILKKVYDHTIPGGCFVLVEKVLGDGPTIDEHLVEHYHAYKEASGYSREEIEAKAKSLEGALVPLTARQNEQTLRDAGFRQVDSFWRYLSFAAWIAIK